MRERDKEQGTQREGDFYGDESSLKKKKKKKVVNNSIINEASFYTALKRCLNSVQLCKEWNPVCTTTHRND